MESLRDIGRSSGVILHPTSLPGPYGIGDLGPTAYRWVDVLAESGTRFWQVLPLGPTGYGDSPYQSLSAFAGNTNLISPELLVADGLVDPADPPPFPEDRVRYEHVIAWKQALVGRAFEVFARDGGHDDLRRAYASFAGEHAWLDDYALFTAIKEDLGGGSWLAWPDRLRMRSPAALERERRRLVGGIERVRFGQFLFFRQWRALRRYAGGRGVRIFGDVPYFVACDSADVWSRPELFRLDRRRFPHVVAGVPPDYFSASGQRWGNPLYDWAEHARTGYRWWGDRLAAAFEQVDLVRVDHFRAFVDYWEIPAGSPTAVEGVWRDGPGVAFFDAMRERLGEVPIVAEDLGDLSAGVPALLDTVGIPGMRVLAFGFSGDESNNSLPHHYPEQVVAYTATHDNDTTLGWWEAASEPERSFAGRYLRIDAGDPVRAFLEAVWGSDARVAVAPAQDLLRLGSESRMNRPGTAEGNWQWRLPPGSLGDGRIGRELASLNETFGRSASRGAS